MGLFDSLKVRKALMAQQNGNNDEAKAAYEGFYKSNLILCSYILPWAILLMREGGEENFKKAKEILVKAQKAGDINAENRNELVLDFAVCEYKLGNVDKAIELLERLHQKSPCGNLYQTLGYIYVDTGNAEKALDFNLKAIDYDDEDPVVLDNMGQYYYRIENNPEKALEFFRKAHEQKPGQIDTLWFLSRYDIENGKKADAIEKLETALEGRFSPLNYKGKADIEAELARLKA